MLKFWRGRWQGLKQSKPGERFVDAYERSYRTAREGFPWRKVIIIIAALVSFVIAFVLMFIPGPAVVFYFIGAGLLASEFRWMAVLLDRLELKLRSLAKFLQRWWKQASWRARIAVTMLAAVVTLAALWGMYVLWQSRR
jgi:hypothetical protein